MSGDSIMASDLPDPPHTTVAPSNSTTWRWTVCPQVATETTLWIGSTSAGLRLYVKGDDPLWQAGVLDSRATPQPPVSWYNNGTGGVTVESSGKVVAFSGTHTLTPGDTMSFAWSLLVTPVRPFNLSAHFQERWAQLGVRVETTIQGGGSERHNMTRESCQLGLTIRAPQTRNA